MSESIRSFIAVKIADCGSLRRVIRRLQMMGRPVKTVDPANLHVTLKFLGVTQRSLIGEICAVLDQVVTAQPAFELRLSGLGAFPRLERPNVIWAGLQNTQTLSLIAAELETALLPFGFDREKQPFHPHLTLARVKSRPPAELRTIVQEYRSTDFSTVLLKSAELIQSELLPDGPKYIDLYSAKLAERGHDR